METLIEHSTYSEEDNMLHLYKYVNGTTELQRENILTDINDHLPSIEWTRVEHLAVDYPGESRDLLVIRNWHHDSSVYLFFSNGGQCLQLIGAYCSRLNENYDETDVHSYIFEFTDDEKFNALIEGWLEMYPYYIDFNQFKLKEVLKQ